jgi:lipopolysaccharide export system permease protein
MIYVGKKDERHSMIYDITIYDLQNGLMVTAPKGELKDFEEENIIQFILYNGELHQLIDQVKYQRTAFTKQTINMTVNTELVRKERTYRNENELSIGGLWNEIKEVEQEIAEIKSSIAQSGADAIDAYMKNDMNGIDVARFQIEKGLSTLKGKERKNARYRIAVNKKFSLAFACIVFVILGAPIGYLFKRGGIAGILLGIFLFSSYYILVLAGEEFADRRGFSPFWAMWLPNIILLAFGIYLFFVAEYERMPFKPTKT